MDKEEELEELRLQMAQARATTNDVKRRGHMYAAGMAKSGASIAGATDAEIEQAVGSPLPN